MFIFKACRAKGGRHSPTYPAPLGGVPKRVYMTMENFAQLLEESFTLQEMNPGEVITAEVVGIDQNFVTVNAGLKSESLIDVAEFKNAQGEIEVKVGDFVTVTMNPLKTASAKPNCPAKKPNVLPTGSLWKKRWKTATSCPALSMAKSKAA